MKIPFLQTVIHGSERKGRTYHIARKFVEKIASQQDNIAEFYLPKDMSSFCVGCANCFSKGEAFCPHYKKYGTTKQYAEWIAKELDASIFEASSVKPVQLLEYDVVVLGGGLYAGGIIGVNLIAKNPCKSLVVFTVGLATPEITNYKNILLKSFSPESLSTLKVFHLHGGMDYGKLGMLHKAMMALKKKESDKTPVAERTSDDHLLLET